MPNDIWEKGTDRTEIVILITHLLNFVNNDGSRQIEFRSQLIENEIRFSIKHDLRSSTALALTMKEIKCKWDGNISTFENAYVDQLRIFNEKQNTVFINQYIPLNFEIDTDAVSSFKIFGYLIEIIPFKTLCSEVKFQEYIKYRSIYEEFKNYKYQYIFKINNVCAKDDLYNLIKGILEFCYGYLDSRLFASSFCPRSKIPYPRWNVWEKNGIFNLSENLCDSRGNEVNFFRLNKEKFQYFLNLCALFNERPLKDSILELISNCLTLYTAARETKYPHWAFLGFWQIIELITCSQDVRGNTDIIIRRMSSIVKLKDETKSNFHFSLKEIARIRNQIVHYASDAIEEDIITLLKIRCDLAIKWLINMHKEIPTVHHLREFLHFQNKNKIDIQRVHDVLNIIKK